MRINEGILDDLEARSADIRNVISMDDLRWPGDDIFTVYITAEFTGTFDAVALRALCDNLSLFLDVQHKIDIYSKMCPTDANYRMIRDLDAAIAQNKKFRNVGIDFAIGHHFTKARDVVRFYVKLVAFCGKKLRMLKVRANYGKNHSIEIDKVFMGFVNKIFFKDWKTNSTVTKEMFSETLSLVNINMPDNEKVALEVIDIFKPSYDVYAKKIHGRLYRESQLYPSFDIFNKNNYVILPEKFQERLLNEHISWEQFQRLGEPRSDMDDLIAVTNGGAEIQDNRIVAAEVLSDRSVKFHNVIFRHNKEKNLIIMCVTLNPFIVDTHKYRPNFELVVFTYVMHKASHYLHMLQILWPWMKEKDYQTIWKNIG